MDNASPLLAAVASTSQYNHRAVLAFALNCSRLPLSLAAYKECYCQGYSWLGQHGLATRPHCHISTKYSPGKCGASRRTALSLCYSSGAQRKEATEMEERSKSGYTTKNNEHEVDSWRWGEHDTSRTQSQTIEEKVSAGSHGRPREKKGQKKRIITERFVVKGVAPLGLILEERPVHEEERGSEGENVNGAGVVVEGSHYEGARRGKKKRRIEIVGERSDGVGSIAGKGLVSAGDIVVGISATFGGMWQVGGSVNGVVNAVESRRGKEVMMEVQRVILHVTNLSDNGIGVLCEEWGKLKRVGAGDRVKSVIIETVESFCRELVDNGNVGDLGLRSVEALVSCVYQRWGIDMGERAWNAVMGAYVKCGSPQRAVDVFDEIENPSVECYTTYISALGALSRSAEALDVLKEMVEAGVRPNVWTYNAVISACVREGRLDRAHVLFGEMVIAGVHPNTVSWNILINWHVRQKRGMERLEGAAQTFADMKESGIKPDVVTYTTLMKAYAMSGRLGKAESILEEMRERGNGIQVDTSAYNSLLEVYVARHDWRRCVELLYEMKNIHLLHAESNVQGHSDLGVQDDNAEVDVSQDESEPPLPNAITYSLVIKACAQSGQVERAEYLFNEMISAGFRPPPKRSVMSLMRAYSHAGHLSKCYALLQDLRRWKIQPGQRFFSALMNCCVEDGNPTLALDIFAKIKSLSIKPDAVTNTILIKSFCLKGEYDHAFNVLKAMHKTSHPPNIITYNTLIAQCLKQQEPGYAIRALSLLLRDDNVRPNRHTFDALIPPKNMESTESRLTYLLSIVEKLKEMGAWANGKLYVEVIDTCEMLGKWRLGRSIMMEKRKWGFHFSRSERQEARRCEERFQITESGRNEALKV